MFSTLAIVSKSLNAVRRLQISFDLSFDRIMEASRSAIWEGDIPAMESMLMSCSIARNGELWGLLRLKKES